VSADENFELASLADGSLAPERRAALEAQVAASAELAGRLREQEQAVALARSAAAAVEAPAALRARIDAQRRRRQRRVPPRRAWSAGVAAAAAAVGVGAAVFTAGTRAQRFHAALGPTALARRARGEATLTRTASGWRIQLAAAGLPRLQDGRFYEAWLRNAAGVLVPIGTFDDGRHVTLWAGVSPESFTTLTVTRERADGEQGSSGQKVLAGTVDTR
jgi:anti-sigma factor RsiW